MKNSPYVETRKDGFFIDTYLDSDSNFLRMKALQFIVDLLGVLAPEGEISSDEIIDLYSYISNRRELEDFSIKEVEEMLAEGIESLS